MFLPFCTWDKFGDILANSGGWSIGLYDEVVSFFASMHEYVFFSKTTSLWYEGVSGLSSDVYGKN
jgi:hypothetical protein